MADIKRPGMLHAVFVRSPRAHPRIVSIDTSAAMALRGVVAVLTASDIDCMARSNLVVALPDKTYRQHRDRFILAAV